MTHAEAVPRWLKSDGIGVEIGAFKNPVPGIKPFYVDRCATYAYESTNAEFICAAHDLPFHSHSLDYVVSSHVLEHLANPVRALLEWHRVLKPGGIIYLVVPDRRFTFDHHRALTDPEHMWADFLRGTDASDGTHIDEFFDHVDWSRYRPDLPPERVPAERELWREKYRIASHGGVIDMHFHVFEPGNLRALIEIVAARRHLAWTIVEQQEQFPADCPNGILLVVRVDKRGAARVIAQWRAWRARRNRRSVLRSEARPWAPDAEAERR